MIKDFDKFRETIEDLKRSTSIFGFGIQRGSRLPKLLRDLADCISDLSKHVEEMEKEIKNV